jgi:ABC-type Fe3+-hydroxamate transport system substrate-binding protein
VIASFHQRAFAEWLGLKIIGEMRRPEDVSPRELERLMALKPEAIVANLQEGTQAAESLGQRLGVPVIVFSNFPNAEGYGRGYEGLLASNLDRLDRTWAKP